MGVALTIIARYQCYRVEVVDGGTVFYTETRGHWENRADVTCNKALILPLTEELVLLEKEIDFSLQTTQAITNALNQLMMLETLIQHSYDKFSTWYFYMDGERQASQSICTHGDIKVKEDKQPVENLKNFRDADKIQEKICLLFEGLEDRTDSAYAYTKADKRRLEAYYIKKYDGTTELAEVKQTLHRYNSFQYRRHPAWDKFKAGLFNKSQLPPTSIEQRVFSAIGQTGITEDGIPLTRLFSGSAVS